MNILKKISIALAGLAALFFAIGFFLPNTAHVERSIVIDAPPATVFTVLNGFRQFHRWSPWQEYDPNMQVAYEGPETGVGAKQSWSGNAEVGRGSQEILESEPYRRILIRLQFGDFGGDFLAPYTLEPENGGTRLTWGFDADYKGSIMGRYFGLFSDSMLGPDYERGLGKLKTFVETLPKADFSGLGISIIDVPPVTIVSTSGSSAADDRALGVALGVAYGRLSGFMQARGLSQAGSPLAIYRPPENGAVRFEAGIPIDRTDVAPGNGIQVGKTLAGKAVKAVYRGAYAGLAQANEQVRAFITVAGYERDGNMWEQYVSDPGTTPESQLITHIYYPIK
jgi:effector-binding domain-containing protein/uncharacterized protein YndB with AHSA1/START domain